MVNDTVPLPLLTITDEIAEVAALVAEADAVGRAGNVTKRAVAASGTFWMGSIARRVPYPGVTTRTTRCSATCLTMEQLVMALR